MRINSCLTLEVVGEGADIVTWSGLRRADGWGTRCPAIDGWRPV